MNKNILVILESLEVNDSSATKGRIAFLHQFLNAGFKVEALHYTRKKIDLQQIKTYQVKENKTSLLFVLSRFQRLMNRWFQLDISNYVDSLFGFSFGFYNDRNSIIKALKKIDTSAFSLIITFGKGNSYRTHAALLKQQGLHEKWWAYVHDPFPQQLYPRPYNFVPYGFKHKRLFFSEVTKKANRILFPSFLLYKWMKSYYVDIGGKTSIFPHPISNQRAKADDLPDYFDNQKFNILHAGNLLNLRNPKTVLKAFKQFLELNIQAKENARLYFIGKHSIFQDYLDEIHNKYSQVFVSKDYVPFKNVYAMQQLCSLNIILEADSEISPFLPGKFPHCVAADKPIICVGPYYSETKRLLGQDYSLAFEFDEIEKLAYSFNTLFKQWQKDPSLLRLNRPDLLHYLSPDYTREQLIKYSE